MNLLLLTWLASARAWPEQVRLALASNPSEMVVSWACSSPRSSVWYGERGGASPLELASDRVAQYSVAADDLENLEYSSPYLHSATLRSLRPAAEYEYYVGNATHVSRTFRFRAALPRGATPADEKPLVIAVVGDIGQTAFSNETAIAMASFATADGVTPEAAVLVGDLSYADGQGPRWDSWGRLMEPLTAELPLMVIPGNHEIEAERGGATFRGYRARYVMPQAAPERVADGAWGPGLYETHFTYEFGASYYSFVLGRTKWIMLNTYVDAGEFSLQRAWLERELHCADRAETPWIFVAMHAPWYNTNEKHRADAEMATQQHRAGLEAVLAGAGVALVLAGHVHAYERSHPVCFDAVRADAPTFVTIGDGGNREQLYDEWPFHRDEKWSAFRNGTKYGFGVLTVYNDTTAKWEWLPNERRVADAVWLRNVAPGGCDLAAPTRPADCDADAAEAADARVLAARAARRRADKRSEAGSAWRQLRPVLAFFVLLFAVVTNAPVLYRAARRLLKRPRRPNLVREPDSAGVLELESLQNPTTDYTMV